MTFSILPPSSSENANLTSAPGAGVIDAALAAQRRQKKSVFHEPEVKLIVQISLALAFVFGLFMFDGAVMGDTASLSLQVGDQSRLFVGEVTDGMTVLDTLYAASIAGNFRFSFANEGGKVKIVNLLTDIDSEDDLNRYAFFINGQKINPDEINSIRVRPSDSVVVKVLMPHGQK